MNKETEKRLAEARKRAIEIADLFGKPGTGSPIIPINFFDYDIIIVNSSGGKDSSVALWEIDRIAKQQDYPKDRIIVSHQDLNDAEWDGTSALAKEQADMFGYKFVISAIQKNKKKGPEGYDTILNRTLDKHYKNIADVKSGKKKEMTPPWPDNNNRWCTSDFKRTPGARVITALAKGIDRPQILYVFGFRSQESTNRGKIPILKRNPNVSSKDKKDPTKKEVWDFLPVHDWSEDRVWEVIKENNIPYHKAYDLGMPRLSCVFCIYAGFDALTIAGIANPELLDKYCDVEDETGYVFKIDGTSLNYVRQKIAEGYDPRSNGKKVEWDKRM